MSNHTPGPWYAEEQSYDSSSFYIRGSTPRGERLTWGKGAVAHIPRSTVMPMYENARLIAAAPDLLEALNALLSIHIAHHNDPIHVAARAAVSKATGEKI